MSALEIILIVITLQAVAIALLLGATVVTHRRRSGIKVCKLQQLWGQLLPAALSGKHEATARIRSSLDSNAAIEAFHRLLDERLRHEQTSSPLALRHLSREIGFTDRLQHQLLHARDPLDRAAAAKTLARLREGIAQGPALELLGSKDPAVVLAAAYATASLRDPNQFLPVFRAIYGRTPITLHGAAELLSGFQDGVCPVIHQLLAGVVDRCHLPLCSDVSRPIDPQNEVDCGDTAALVVMIDLLTFYAYTPAASTLMRMLRLVDDEEVIIHLVKAIAKVGDCTAAPRLIELLVHPNWVVRSQSVLALTALEAMDSTHAIRALLDDESLRVRASATHALRSLEGAEALAEVFA